jgi:protein-disulfide isomerase
MKPNLFLAMAALLTLAPVCRAQAKDADKSADAASKATPGEDAVKAALEKHPEYLLDVLREHRKEFFDIVQDAAQEEQAHRQKEQQEAEEKAFDEAFKNPLKPVVDDKAHQRGNKKAKYTLVEYSDFQCPYCGRGFTVVEALRKKYGDDLLFVFKNLPLPMHPMSMPAAKYFEAASLQSMDKAWALHDKLFQNQAQLSEDFIKSSAKELGLNVEKLEKDSQSEAVKTKIDADMQEANGFDFSGTPGFLLNGIPVRGAYPVEKFDSIIEKLKENGKKG